MTRRAPFRQSDLARALRAAKSAGTPVAAAEIDQQGRIVLQFGPAQPGKGTVVEGPDDWKARLREARGWAQ